MYDARLALLKLKGILPKSVLRRIQKTVKEQEAMGAKRIIPKLMKKKEKKVEIVDEDMISPSKPTTSRQRSPSPTKEKKLNPTIRKIVLDQVAKRINRYKGLMQIRHKKAKKIRKKLLRLRKRKRVTQLNKLEYDFTKYCTPTCEVPKIKDWQKFLEYEKHRIRGFFNKALPLNQVNVKELRFIRMRQAKWSPVLIAKRKLEIYGVLLKKYYLVKPFNKLDVINWNILKFIKNERRIMANLKFPFLSHLEFCVQDNLHVYFGYPLLPGQTIRFHLTKMNRFKEPTVKFIAAQILLALEYLHYFKIIYRNLRPENIIIEPNGYIKITSFMKAKHIKSRTLTKCFDLEYAAPETFTGDGYDTTVDWWAYAVNIFEMGCGFTPFETGNYKETVNRIVNGKFKQPGIFSPEMKNLLQNLLIVKIGERGGTDYINGINFIKRHIWFDCINWVRLFNREYEAPFQPGLKNPIEEQGFVYYDKNCFKISRFKVHEKLFSYF